MHNKHLELANVHRLLSLCLTQNKGPQRKKRYGCLWCVERTLRFTINAWYALCRTIDAQILKVGPISLRW